MTDPTPSCCAGRRSESNENHNQPREDAAALRDSTPPVSDNDDRTTGMVRIGGGRFLMGSDSDVGFPEDGEGPVRQVTVDPFYVDRHAVTNAEFLEFVRDQGLPVTYTRVVPTSYDDPDHEDLDIVDPVAPESEDTVIDKSYASAFYGTDLLSRLVRGDHDSVIIVGNSTSGCIRATTIDAQQHGFDVILPQECLFDRIEASHKIGLLDLWMKYAEVQEREEVEAYVESHT